MDKRSFLQQAGAASVAAGALLASRPARAQASSSELNILIAYHSVTGNTEKMAQGVADGAKSVSGTNVLVKRVGDVVTDDLLSSDAIIVGSPVYFGNVSGDVKTFFDNWLLTFGVFRDFKMAIKLEAHS
jgi:NAD(P)H dehydrogenase (quinone)